MSVATRTPIEVRLMRRVEVQDDGCWLWTGATLPNGYGYIGRGGREGGATYAHRVSYEAHVGPIPDGFHVHHSCRNRVCVNPKHLVALTPKQHGAFSDEAQRTHCPRGHAYTPENTRRFRNKRQCRECRRIMRRAGLWK